MVKHEFLELPEKIACVERARSGFRMVLHGERRQRLVANTFNCAVVQIDMRDFQIVAQRIRHDGEVMVLRCDFNRVREQIFNRMVAAMMAEMKPPRARSAS